MKMECKRSECIWYHRTNPFGNRSYCGFLGHEGLVWCDEIKDCKWFEPRMDTESRLRRLEKAVIRKESNPGNIGVHPND